MLRSKSRRNRTGQRTRGKNIKDDLIRELRSTNVRYSWLPMSGRIDPGDPIHQLKLAFTVSGSTVTTGAFAQTYQLSAASINHFAARLAVLFQEYVIIKLEMAFNPVATNPGASGQWNVWGTEDDTTTPTVNEALNSTPMLLPNSTANPRQLVLHWTLKNGEEAAWTVTSNTSPVFYNVKVFANTSAPGFFLATDSTSTLSISGYITVLFRGWKNT